MDPTGQASREALRERSFLRVETKKMLREGKIVEVEPGVFKPSWWYAMDLELKRRLKKEG